VCYTHAHLLNLQFFKSRPGRASHLLQPRVSITRFTRESNRRRRFLDPSHPLIKHPTPDLTWSQSAKDNSTRDAGVALPLAGSKHFMLKIFPNALLFAHGKPRTPNRQYVDPKDIHSLDLSRKSKDERSHQGTHRVMPLMNVVSLHVHSSAAIRRRIKRRMKSVVELVVIRGARASSEAEKQSSEHEVEMRGLKFSNSGDGYEKYVVPGSHFISFSRRTILLARRLDIHLYSQIILLPTSSSRVRGGGLSCPSVLEEESDFIGAAVGCHEGGGCQERSQDTSTRYKSHGRRRASKR
jgi:hypothetical protein